MSQGVEPVNPSKEQRYYVALGRGCDAILRCKDCQQLVLIEKLKTQGCCDCGNKRMAEIVTLSEAEMAQIVSGVIDFPYREQFLAEFTANA